MNVTINISDGIGPSAASSTEDKSAQPSGTGPGTPTDGGAPTFGSNQGLVSAGGDTAAEDIGGPPAWLTEEINASKTSSATESADNPGHAEGSDGGTAPEF
ncbi:hypothetical protein BH24BAC1_BH24BAC1_18520 [soil metagenome]